MSPTDNQNVRDLLFQLEGKIRPLQWDADHNQINQFKKLQLERLSAERESLLQELENIEKQ